MSTLKVNNLQVGQDGTAANNYTLYQPASPDGTLKLGIGVAGNVTSNILSFNDSGSRLRINTITGSTGLNVVGADTNGYSDIEITAAGTSGSSRLYFSDTAGKAGSIIYNHSDNSLGFTTSGGSTDITVDNVGRLLIGRTTPLASSSERFAIDSGMSIMRLNSTTTGALYLRNEDTTADTRHPYLMFFDGSGNRGGIGIQNDSSNMWISGQTGIAFRTGGSAPSQDERLRITQGGYVGINQSSPAQHLHIHAPNTSLAAIRLSGTASSQVEYDIRQGIVGVSNAGFSIRDITNSATRFVITSTGRVGIGTDSPDHELQVKGDISIDNESSTDPSMLHFNARNKDNLDPTSRINFWETDTHSTSYTDSHAFIEYNGSTAGGDNGYLSIGGYVGVNPNVDILTVSRSGKVGIGTINPTRMLHVASTGTDSLVLVTGTTPQIRLNSSATDNNDATRAIFGLATASQHFFNSAVSGDACLRTTDGGNLLFGEGTTERARINSAGNFGVGNISPTQARLVAQTASGMSIAAVKDNTGASISLGGVTQPRILMEAGATASEFKLYVATGNSYASAGWQQKLHLSSGGKLGIGNTNPDTTLTVNGSINVGAAVYGKRFADSTTVDTGLMVGTNGTFSHAVIEVIVSGNPNHFGSGYYRASSTYLVHIGTGWTGSNLSTIINATRVSYGVGGSGNSSEITATFVLYNANNNTEYSSGTSRNSNHQLRVKIAGCSTASGARCFVKVLSNDAWLD